MPKAATSETVGAAVRKPQFRQAVQTLRTIKAKKDKVSSVNGEISGIYDRMEGYKVNKKAARMFFGLDGLEEAERAEIISSLNGLMDAAGWPERNQDLADRASGVTRSGRVGEKAQTPEPEEKTGEGDVDDDEAGGDESEKVDADAFVQTAGSNVSPLDAARQHLSGVAAPASDVPSTRH